MRFSYKIKLSFFMLSLSMFFLSIFLVSCSSCKDTNLKDSITMWHWMSDREDAFVELAKRYEKETGTKVNIELYALSDTYSQKIRAGAQTNTLPDIFGILGEKKDFASFVKAGHIYNLTEHMKQNDSLWENSLFSKALAVNEFKPGNSFGVEPGIYGVPIDVTNIQMLYNKDLLEKVGWPRENPPLTWKEFVEVSRLLKNNNIQGLVSGWGEIWMIDCFANNYAFNTMGEEKVMDTIKGLVPYTDPDWIKVFDLFREMRDEDMLSKGIVTMINKTAEQLFANNKAAFAFNGSWSVNVYDGMNPDLKYGVMLPPKVTNTRSMVIWGGAGSSFMVNKKSKSPEKAVAFLKWLTDAPQQAYLARETKNLPSNKQSLKDIPETLSQFADDMDNATHPSIWEVSEYPVVIEALNKGIQSIIIGEKTPEELATEVQAVKERELMKLENK